MDTPVPASAKSRLWILLLLMLLLLGGVLALLGNVSTTTTTTTAGHCPRFDPQREAYKLAVQAEQWRKGHRFGGNYANASFLVCFADGKTLPGRVRPVQGYYDKKNPTASWKTHSEQGVYVFLKPKLSGLKLDPKQVVAIDVVIFSQVAVCTPCRTSMIPWQAGLRQAAGIPNLFLSIWDLGTNGFDPEIYPSGTGTPVAIDALHQVDIVFAP